MEKAKLLLSVHKGKVIIGLIVLIAVFLSFRRLIPSTPKVSYQTAQAQRGDLVTSVSASGTIAAGNSEPITTGASGVVQNLYVQNGDSVTSGQTIATLNLDLDSQQKQASAWSSYLQSKAKVDSDNATLNTLQNAEFVANQKFINDAVARGLLTTDPTYIEENASWLAAEANYKNQQSVIAADEASVNSAWLAYQSISNTVVAPGSGVITDLNLTPGMQISAQSNSSSSGSSSQTIGTVAQSGGQTEATVSLSEIDATKVKVGDKATMTLDAFRGKTFTGSVSSINTIGVVSSGVTTYPATIVFFVPDSSIYPNMAVTANIITKIDSNVLYVPSEAIQSSNGQDTVRVMKNSQITEMPVETGDSNDTDTVITSGLNPGDTVVVGVINTSNRPSGNTSSPFSGTRGFGGGGGGNVIFRGGGGGRGG